MRYNGLLMIGEMMVIITAGIRHFHRRDVVADRSDLLPADGREPGSSGDRVALLSLVIGGALRCILTDCSSDISRWSR